MALCHLMPNLPLGIEYAFSKTIIGLVAHSARSPVQLVKLRRSQGPDSFSGWTSTLAKWTPMVMALTLAAKLSARLSKLLDDPSLTFTMSAHLR